MELKRILPWAPALVYGPVRQIVAESVENAPNLPCLLEPYKSISSAAIGIGKILGKYIPENSKFDHNYFNNPGNWLWEMIQGAYMTAPGILFYLALTNTYYYKQIARQHETCDTIFKSVGPLVFAHVSYWLMSQYAGPMLHEALGVEGPITLGVLGNAIWSLYTR